jgi:hypothetical protein
MVADSRNMVGRFSNDLLQALCVRMCIINDDNIERYLISRRGQGV